jgi:hypothetical protein
VESLTLDIIIVPVLLPEQMPGSLGANLVVATRKALRPETRISRLFVEGG